MTRATIQVPRPCAEAWEAMTPTAQGRHCRACQHTVTDFTQRTDAEILALLRQAAGARVCGRFRAEQLNRELVHAPEPAAPRWRAWLLTAAALWAGPATAQSLRGTHSGGPVPGGNAPMIQQIAPGAQQTAPVDVSGRSAAVPDTVEGVKLGEPTLEEQVQRVSGQVVDQATGDHIPGATVLIKGSKTGTYTQMNGGFVLEGPFPTGAVLLVSAVGYIPQEIKLVDMTQPVILQMEAYMLGGLVYLPAWHTPRGLWYRLRALPRRLTGQW